MEFRSRYLIIGGGPAGIQLAYFLQRRGLSYQVLERADCAGSFFKKFPRHRKLISINKVHTGHTDNEINLRWDWNSLLTEGEDELLFKHYSKEYFPDADQLPRYLQDFVDKFQLRIRFNCAVTKVWRDEEGKFRAENEQGDTFISEILVVATGFFIPNLPEIQGIELAETYVDVDVDPANFENQRVLVIGKGNSGFETADNLIQSASLIHVLSRNSVKLAWQTHYVGDLRAVNNNLLDTYQLKSGNALLDAKIESITKCDRGLCVRVNYTNANEVEDIVYDRVIVCTGWRFDHSIFEGACKPKLAIMDRYPEQNANWESVNVPDMYFIGTLSAMRGYRKNQSAFIHGFRYNVRFLANYLGTRYEAQPLPSRLIDRSPRTITEEILARMNRSSALWQQFNMLSDVVAIDADGQTRYYEEIPRDFIADSELSKQPHLLTITQEFGKTEHDPFSIKRVPVPEMAEKSAFLHPIIRYYQFGEQMATCHLLENLFGEWKDEVAHVQPLVRFIEQALEMNMVST